MRQLAEMETVSSALRRLVRRDTLTNLFLSPVQLQRAIRAGALFEEQENSFLLLWPGDPNRLYFIAGPGAVLSSLTEPSDPLVCEVARKSDDFTPIDVLLSPLGVQPILRRRRLLHRPAILSGVARPETIHIARPEEAETVLRILSVCFDPLTGCLPTEEEFAADLEAGHFLLYGNSGLLHYSLEGKTSELKHLAVLPEARRSGVASSLLSDYLELLGERSSRLWVAEVNPVAQALYARFGYREDGYISTVYQRK